MELLEKINSNDFTIGVIGLGYVGLPLVKEFSQNGVKVIGFDIDIKKINLLNEGKSYINQIKDATIKQCKVNGFEATSDFSIIKNTDVILICVPTPLGSHREPDLTFVINTANKISKYLRNNQIIILVSTTYPGTTEEILLPILEKSGLKAGKDFFLAYSPEREDPANEHFNAYNIPKIVGGYTKNCLKIACSAFNKINIKTIPVSSTRVAESAKLLENIYRAVNISMVNELKMIFDKMGIDIFEVIDAAKTKPFGFQAFYPGPGLGGHCIPIDPFYLTWKAKEYDYNTKFIELAGEINSSMPNYVVSKTIEVLNEKGKVLKGSKVLVLGVAYKKNVDDMRESPALKLMELFIRKGAFVDYSDPYINELPKTRHYSFEKQSVDLTEENLKIYDCVIVNADHDLFDKAKILKNSKLIIDTRNMFKIKGLKDSKVRKA